MISVLFFFSGAIGLAYELIWIHLLGLQFGHSAWAISTVVGVFMWGLALGSWFVRKRTNKISNPYRTYAWIEGGIAIYGLCSYFLLNKIGIFIQPLYPILDSHYIAFGIYRAVIASLALFLPTFLMGATLPVLVEGRRSQDFGKSLAWLYGINTLGAMFGTLAVGLFLFPWIGLKRTLWTVNAIGFSVSIAAFFVMTDKSPVEKSSELKPVAPAKFESSILTLTAFLTGFIGLLYELSCTRMLAMVLGSSTYTFTIVLATFLLATGAGSLGSARLNSFRAGTRGLIGAIVGLIGFGGLIMMLLSLRLNNIFVYLAIHLPKNLPILLCVQALVAASVVLLPAYCLGALLPILTTQYSRNQISAGHSVGHLYAANTLGAIFGSIVTGFWLFPWIGLRQTIVVGVAIAGTLSAILFLFESEFSRARKTKWIAYQALILIAAIPICGDIDLYRYAGRFRSVLNQKESLISYSEPIFLKDGVSSTIAVFQSNFQTWYSSNGKVEASTLGDLPTQYLVGHIPMICAKGKSKVAVIGLGSGATVHALLLHPSVQSVTVVEIEPAVVDIQNYFRSINFDAIKDKRVTLKIEDGRTFLTNSREKFDVIVSEPSNPWVSGVSLLFSQQFYRAIKSRLTPGGVFAQWIQGYEISRSTFKMMVRTLNDSFPNIKIFYVDSDFICVSSESPIGVEKAELQNADVRANLQKIKIKDIRQIEALLMFQLPRDQAIFGRKMINTDENFRLEYRAPMEMYRRKKLNVDKLRSEAKI